jgi:telomerase Cajal body protein 1
MSDLKCPLAVTSCDLYSYTEYELVRSMSKSSAVYSFLKESSFSPDGRSILCSSEDGTFLLYDVDVETIEEKKYYRSNDTCNISHTRGECHQLLGNLRTMSAGESIYDFSWYPHMNSSDPTTCCFAYTSRDHPIHLWGNVSNALLCSYSCYDDKDELVAANSLCFNLNGNRLYAGSNRMIRSFDLYRPGRDCQQYSTCKSRKDVTGQRGIISALRFNPDYSGAFAAGSYARDVTIYTESMDGPALELRDVDFAVTCLRWSPDGNNLWAGGRAHDDIICWDLRNTRKEIGRVTRKLCTNQRMVFDLDPWGKYLATGTQDGR